MDIDKSIEIDTNSLKVPKLSRKQQQIVKAKVKGHKNKDIAKIHYPKANPQSQASIISSELRKPNVAQYYEQSKLQALKEHNITWSRVIKPISDGLTALNSKEEIDHNTRLRASKQAVELLHIKEVDQDTREQLLNLPNVDEIQLIRLMQNKPS